ncbi:MAG TPA: RtcB family protein, partial [Bacillota bacterium]|nr:RtcB family protein [Bacillota bacterium]
KIAITPDFHKGAGIPIGTVLATRGFVIPQAIGNDVNCGMRVYATGYTEDDIRGKLDQLEPELRHAFFEGGRDIPMTGIQREAMFRNGLIGLLNTVPKTQNTGIWELFNRIVDNDELTKIACQGSLVAGTVVGLEDLIGTRDVLTRDNQIGSIGGGNHFVEIQKVSKVIDRSLAYHWKLQQDQIVIMIHTGSLAIGHLSGNIQRDLVQSIYPANLKRPDNGILVLPASERYGAQMEIFRNTLHNAGNFAFANRMFLGLMTLRSLFKVCGEKESRLLYDTPHNFVWEEELDGNPIYLHRKGACPARGIDQLTGTFYGSFGEPVLVPGSMGSASYIMAGLGNSDSLWSASHGAGRSLSRGQALKVDEERLRRFLDEFCIVTPIDFNRPDIKLRKDIINEKLADIKQEAPFAYKEITAVTRTLTDARIAAPVVELKPILTIKG